MDQELKSPVLVTGGSGFIGLHVVARLVERNLAVRVLDLRPPPGDEEDLVSHVPGSILDRDVVRRAMRDVSTVIHAAGNAHLWSGDKRAHHRVNFEGTRIVLGEARRAGVETFVYTSTETILRGWNDRTSRLVAADGDLPSLESMAGPYTRSKWLAEREVRRAVEEGFSAVIVYPTVPLGAGDLNMTAPARLIHRFAFSPPPCFLDCRLNLVAVEDVAEGHLLAAERGRAGDRFLLGGENLWLRELLVLLHECGGAEPPRRTIPYPLAWLTGVVSGVAADYVTRREPLAALEGIRLAKRHSWCDTRPAWSVLGLRPTPLREAVRRVFCWLREREAARSSHPA